MTPDEQTLRTQLTEARQARQAAAAILTDHEKQVKAIEAALANLLSPVPLGAIVQEKRSYQRKEQSYRVSRLVLRGYNESEVQLMGQPLNKDGSDHARLGLTYIYGDYTVVALPAQEEPAP